ncbi:Ig-like domain-containing protein [Streptomyces sp. NRRL WC-3742]|uniref:Ig-like domain-containing protein n=1 Tax=Streptomyces sp. NRRL WC-3742 TaxID=1463934 RepID=UPI00055BDB8E|nr:Ig-like domain-containing protein [Streptomyces sp. NRRL WC-3742]
MSRQFPRTAAALAVLTAGLLTGWNAPLSVAEQSPDTWSGEHRAVLPSGLSVQLEFAASPGVGITASAGELADRAGGRSATPYADGMHPGDPAQVFAVADGEARTDGSWHPVGTLRLTFSRPVRNPRLHLSGLAALATGKSGTTSTAARLTLTGGSPATPTLTGRTDWAGWTVDAATLAPVGADGSTDGAAGSAAEGTVELAGTIRSAEFRVEQRSTARAGSTTPAPALSHAFTVTVDEDLGTAPQDYGNASHVVSDLFLGRDATGSGRSARPSASGVPGAGGSGAGGSGRGDEPLVQLDHGAARRSPFDRPSVSPPPPRLQPGRGEYQGADPSISFPAEASVGRYYRVTVPVAVGDQPATLAGWIDFDHNGRFDPTERVQVEIPAGVDTGTLEWTVPPGASASDTWARLRIARDTGQLIGSGGFADSGQVSDQKIKLTVGAARPEIADPVDGDVLADTRPQIRGEAAVPGATVEVRDGDTALCRAKAGRGGDWTCRPDTALAGGVHSLTPVETIAGGVVLRGEVVRVSVKTAPPSTPVLTLPEFTNDPALLLTGTGEPGSAVSVSDRYSDSEVCTTAVRADGQWSCIPVENLPDGQHPLTPVAVDAAGNRTTGKPVTLTVDTVAPDKPVLATPASGETVRSSRPKLTGRAEPGVNVQVTARTGGADSADRTVLCGATAALDGSWSCTANRDLTDGAQWLVVTATDRAGNATSGDPVAIRVTAGADTASTSPSPSAAASPSAAVPASVPASAPVSAVASPSASASSPAAGTGTASPSASASASASPSPSASTSASSAEVSPKPSPSAPASVVPEVPVTVPLPPGVLPIPVPAVPVPAPVPGGPSPSAVASASVASPSAVPTVSGSPSAPASPSVAASGLRPVEPGVLPVFVPQVPAPVPPGPTVPSVAAPKPSAPPNSPKASASPSPSQSQIPSASAQVTASPSASPSASASASASAGSRAALAPADPPSSPSAVVEEEQPEGAAARPQAAPPSEGRVAAAPPGESARRGLLAGVLLVLAGIALITRRVIARGPGSRRR